KISLLILLILLTPLIAFANSVTFRVQSTFNEPIHQKGWNNVVFFQPDSTCLVNPPPVHFTYVCVSGRDCKAGSSSPVKEITYDLKPGCNHFKVNWFVYDNDTKHENNPPHPNCSFSIHGKETVTLHISGNYSNYVGVCTKANG
ncbi:MAG: hypothetical protein AAGG80_04745, partial [Pseudomonadota bacterium]